MNQSRVVEPSDRRLTISKGDWLRVKDRLNAGENKNNVRRGRPGGFYDGVSYTTAKVMSYLLDWSLVDASGKKIPITSDQEKEAALDSIDPESYQEIIKVIDQHEQAMQAERDAEKKSQDGEINEPAISPSPVAAAGPSNTSEI